MEEKLMTSGMSTQINTSPVSEGSFAFATDGEVVNNQTFDTDNETDMHGVDRVDQDVQNADELLATAKEEGIEEALIRLADGDFEEVEDNTEEEEGKTILTTAVEEIEVIDEDDELKEPKEEKTDPEKEAIKAHVIELESQVINLSEKNEELVNRVKQLEGNLDVSLLTLLQMTRLLQEMAKKEEDDEEKEGILELAFDMFQFFVKSIVLDDETLKQQETQGSHETPNKKGKGKNKEIQALIAQYMQKLMEKQSDSHLPPLEIPKAA